MYFSCDVNLIFLLVDFKTRPCAAGTCRHLTLLRLGAQGTTAWQKALGFKGFQHLRIQRLTSAAHCSPGHMTHLNGLSAVICPHKRHGHPCLLTELKPGCTGGRMDCTPRAAQVLFRSLVHPILAIGSRFASGLITQRNLRCMLCCWSLASYHHGIADLCSRMAARGWKFSGSLGSDEH